MEEEKLYTSKTITDYLRQIAGKFDLKQILNDDERYFLIRFLHEYADNRDKRAEAHLVENSDPTQSKKNARVVSLRIGEEFHRYLGKPFVKRSRGRQPKE